ncbi:MAG: radical SAM protein [Elusimicrobiota bacterium]
MTARRVLLINPPLLLDKEFIDYPYFTGLGVLSNASVLRARGFSVSVADAQASADGGGEPPVDGRIRAGCGIDSLLAAVSGDFDAVVVAVPPYLLPHVLTSFASQLFAAVRRRFSSARLVAADCYFGGMHYVEYDGESFLARHPEADALVKYEGETELAELLVSAPESRPALRVGKSSDIEPDSLPFPAWDLIDMGRYQTSLSRFFREAGRPDPFSDGLRTLPAVTSRGCAYRCAFCTANPGQKAPGFRPHSPAYLRRHFSELKIRFGAERLVLLDACPNHDPARFEEILEIIETLGLKCDFPNGLRADKLTFGALKILRRISGSVTISAESGDPTVLSRRIKKGLEIAAVDRVAGWCRTLGLPLSIHYIVGHPGETVETVNRTLAHALRLREETGAVPLVQNFVPIPGTLAHKMCADAGLLGGFDPERLYPHFRRAPVLDLPGLSSTQLSGMMSLFARRLRAGVMEKVIINLTYHCNNDCRFCAVGDRVKKHGDLRRYGELLREYRRRGIDAVDLDGGEPTLYPGFFPLVRFAKKLGYRAITVTTNGRRLADRGFASRFLLSGITDLLVSLHGPTAAVHDHQTRRRGSFEETVRGLRHAVRLKPRRLGLAVNTVITGGNAASVADFFGFVHGLGVEKVNVQFVTPFGRAAGGCAEDDPNILSRLSPAISRWRGRLQIELVNALPCRAPGPAAVEPELGKHSREMVFVDAPPQNLAAYLDVRRRKAGACLACEAAIGCAGFYVFGGGAPARHPSGALPR